MSERDLRQAGGETSRRRKRNEQSFVKKKSEKTESRLLFFNGEISGYDGRNWVPRIDSMWVPPKSNEIKVDRVMFTWAFHDQKASLVKPSAYGTAGHSGDPDEEEEHYVGRVEVVIRKEGTFSGLRCSVPASTYSTHLRDALYQLYRDGADEEQLLGRWSRSLFAIRRFGKSLKIDLAANPFLRLSHPL